ncbi:MAG: hypothetical protein RJA36_3566 [Pseudomonadota bacterium]|jgi:hypothetical protein
MRLAERYLNDRELHDMARAAVNSYELTASWRAAWTAAVEYAQDELRVRPKRSAVALAIRLAQTRWAGRVLSARRA